MGKLTLNMVIDRLRNEESKRKSFEAVSSELDTLVSEKAKNTEEKAKKKFPSTE